MPPTIPFQSLFDLCSVSKCTLPPPDFWKVADDKKDDLVKTVAQFMQGNDMELAMPSALTSGERKIVHDEAEKYSIEHNSQTLPNGERFILLKKK